MVVVFILVFSLTRPVVDGADAFMGALKDGRYEQAYARSAPSLQQELGDAARTALHGPAPTGLGSGAGRSADLRNGIGNVSGSVDLAKRRHAALREIELHQVNGEWRVVAFRFN